MPIINKIKTIIKKNNFIYEKFLNIYKIFLNIKLKIKYLFGTNKDIFTDIYLKNKWGDKFSYSGTGSNLYNTKTIVKELPIILKKLKVKNILDIPCGDFFWIKQIDFDNINYIGADIVSELVNTNIRKYKKTNIDFKILDLLVDELPESDLIFCRDCLVHFSFKDILKAINNIKKSNAKYLFTTNFVQRIHNKNISTGSWRPINLCKPPFNFPQPSLIVFENCSEVNNKFYDKTLSLWDLRQIPIFK